MRIQGTSTAAATGPGAPARRAAGGTFSLDHEGTSRAAASSGGVRTIGGIETLLALQGIEEPGERRKRAVRRGRGALDALDALKLGLLTGTLDAAAVAQLKTAATGFAEQSGDPRLDTVLAEIGLRVEVELAKIGLPRSGG